MLDPLAAMRSLGMLRYGPANVCFGVVPSDDAPGTDDAVDGEEHNDGENSTTTMVECCSMVSKRTCGCGFKYCGEECLKNSVRDSTVALELKQHAPNCYPKKPRLTSSVSFSHFAQSTLR